LAKNSADINRSNREKYATDPRPILARNREWIVNNPERDAAIRRKSREKHADKLRAGRREHYRKNSAIYKARAVARMKHIKIATPLWADMAKIFAIYAECECLTKETGIPHHVDHIYPLRGKTMCGLHVEGNLQILHAVVNLRKSNKVAEPEVAAAFP
jgi:5-methylcytosine-specific restriction endonuclease McrA